MHNFFSDVAEPINYCKGSRAIIAASMNRSGRKPIAGYKEDGVTVESHDILWVGFPESLRLDQPKIIRNGRPLAHRQNPLWTQHNKHPIPECFFTYPPQTLLEGASRLPQKWESSEVECE